MANQDIGIPRFYCDYINFRLSRGDITQANTFDVMATDTGDNLVGIKTNGGTEAELFDMRPLNLVTFDTAASSASKADGVVVALDVMGQTSSKISFIAILNHNMPTATGRFKIAASDTKEHIQAFDFGSATAIQPTEVVNGDTIDGSSPYEVTPATDGSTIVRFAESDLRYWGIQFEGSNSNNFSSTDLTVGCIMVGEYYDMPHAPDMSVKRSIMFDNVKLQDSVGGQRYSNMTSHGRTGSVTSKSPFSTTTVGQHIFGGRLAYDMKFSFLKSTDLMPDEYDTYNPTDDSTVEDIWNITNGPHLPFIFSIDNSTSEEGDNAETQHIFARFAQNSLDMTQVMHKLWTINLRIEEEF